LAPPKIFGLATPLLRSNATDLGIGYSVAENG